MRRGRGTCGKTTGTRLTGGERGARIRNAPHRRQGAGGGRVGNDGRAARAGERGTRYGTPTPAAGRGRGRVGNGGRAARAGGVWEKQRGWGHVEKRPGAAYGRGKRGNSIRHAPTGGRARAGDAWEAMGAPRGGGRGGRIRHAPTGGRARAGDVWEMVGAPRGRGHVKKQRRARLTGGGVWKNARGAAYGRGKRSCTEVPRPGSLSRRRSAPCSAAPCLTMDSPSPVPPAPPSGRAWLLSTR